MPRDHNRTAPAGLSARESEVLRLIALGHVNADIARIIGVSLRTIETDRSHLRAKLGGTTRADLVAFARKHGLI